MTKLKSFLYRLLYALPFGMKAVDPEIMGSSSKRNDGQTVNQETADERVGKHLLKGELTQSVKDLRYRTYKVDDESRNYQYLGQGNAIRKNNPSRNVNHVKFSQTCKLETSGILEEMKRVGDYGTERYTLQVEHSNPLVRFKIEQFATQIDVDVKNGKENTSGSCEFDDCTTKLHFSSVPNGYEKKSAPFINELKRLVETIKDIKKNNADDAQRIIDEACKHCEMVSSIVSISFTTFKASNDEPDLINYVFLCPQLLDAKEENSEVVLILKWALCMSNDIKAKFFDASMANKYKMSAPKQTPLDISGGAERVAHCDVCGKEMNVYDADVTRYTYGKAMCSECLLKHIIH